RRGMFLQMIGSRKTVPPRMFRMVPLGLFHISESLNSTTLASSGVIVAHLIPTLCFLMAAAASTVTLSFVASLSTKRKEREKRKMRKKRKKRKKKKKKKRKKDELVKDENYKERNR